MEQWLTGNSLPIPIAMASSWDTNLIESMGHVVAKETRAYGIHQGYAPMLAVVRDVRWGRIEESYGEDPFLVGNIGTAYAKGLQGMGIERFDKNHIIACSKHYVADGEPMAGANGAAMDLSDYNLHNIHLYPFRMTFEEAKVASIMPAHHLLNGVPCHANIYSKRYPAEAIRLGRLGCFGQPGSAPSCQFVSLRTRL